MRIYPHIRLLFIGFLLAAITPERATCQPVLLQGVVLDATDGTPLPGATVELFPNGNAAATDEGGRFRLDVLREGDYELVVRSLGYRARRESLTLPVGQNLTIRLQRAVLESDEVIVTSSPIGRDINYQPASALSLERLQRQAAPSLGEILDGQPGVATRSFGSAPARPVIRGFDGDRVLVMQNGERMGDLSATAVDHAVALDPLSMDRVEVVRGPASLLYGSGAIGGVVNLFSNDIPREWSAGTHGSLATHMATVNRMGSGLVRVQHASDSFAVTGRMIYRDAGDLRTPDGRLPDTAIHNVSYGSGAGWRTGSFETGVAISGMEIAYGLPEAIDDPAESIEIRMNRINLQSVSTLQIKDRFFDRAELRLHYSDYGHDEIEIARHQDGLLTEELEIAFGQRTLSSSLTFRHRETAGLQGAVGLSVNRSTIRVGGQDALTPDASGHFFAAYLYEELRLHRNLHMKAGARLEQKQINVLPNNLFPDPEAFRDRSDLILSGALGLHYSPFPGWSAGLQVARAYRTPTLEELYSDAPHSAAGSYDLGDPGLGNEFSLGSDLYFDYSGDRVTGQLSLFVNRIDGYVDFSPTGEFHAPSGLPVYRYLSRNAVLYGFELNGSWSFTTHWTLSAGMDYVRGHERGNLPDNLTFIPPLRTQVALLYDNGSAWAGPRIRLISPQRHVAPNEEPTDGYLLIGGDAGYRFPYGVTASLRMDNLLNERYRDHLSRVENRNAPMPGRNLNLMVRWEF